MAFSAPIAQKLAFTFSKTGAARFYSHHDLMRHIERALRRAELKPRLTAGFNPQPRVVFPHALGLGVGSICEVVEIEFVDHRPANAVFQALKKTAAPVMELTGVETMAPVKGGRQPARTAYRIDGWPEHVTQKVLADAADAILSEEKIEVQRGAVDKARTVDMRPYLLVCRVEGSETMPVVHVELQHSAVGAGRIDEVAQQLSLRLGDVDCRSLSLTKIGVEWAA